MLSLSLNQQMSIQTENYDTTNVGVFFVYHMNHITPEFDSFSCECYQTLSSPRF